MFLHGQWRQENPWKLSQQLASHKEEPLFQTRKKMRTNSQCCPPTPTHGLRCTVTHTQRHTHITHTHIHTHPKMIPIIHSIRLFCFFPFIYLLIYLFIQWCIQQTFLNMVCWANPTSSRTGQAPQKSQLPHDQGNWREHCLASYITQCLPAGQVINLCVCLSNSQRMTLEAEEGKCPQGIHTLKSICASTFTLTSASSSDCI